MGDFPDPDHECAGCRKGVTRNDTLVIDKGLSWHVDCYRHAHRTPTTHHELHQMHLESEANNDR